MNTIKGDTRKQKAVAIALYLKEKLGRSSTIINYTPYKVQKLTKIHTRTFVKYLPLMKEMGLVSFCGKSGEHLVINRLHSKVKNRNIDVHRFSFRSFTDVYRSLRAFLLLLIQQRKEYVRHTLQIARNPKNWGEFSAARKAVKRLVRRGILKRQDEKPKECGISYKRIARECGVCVRTAEEVVKYAIGKGWCRKQTHFEWTLMPNVNRMPVFGYLFTTHNYGFNVTANTYTLSTGIKRSLGMVSISVVKSVVEKW